MNQYDAIQQAIIDGEVAKAVAAERERCAKIAEQFNYWNVGIKIARQIRELEPVQ